MRFLITMLLTFLLGITVTHAASDDDDALYTGHAHVNKYDAAIARGYGENLAEVLVKVSGDPRLLTDSRLDALKADAKSFSIGVKFHDLYGGPIHDEQGTRDRPYDMMVTFDKTKIADFLRTLGRTLWTGPRPTVIPVIALKDLRGRSFILATDSVRGIDQREALVPVARTYALGYRLPDMALLTKENLTYARLSQATITPQLDRTTGEAVLVGVLNASENPPGWKVKWRLTWQGMVIRWAATTPSFDAAFKVGFAGAEQVFAGNGLPASDP